MQGSVVVVWLNSVQLRFQTGYEIGRELQMAANRHQQNELDLDQCNQARLTLGILVGVL